MTDLVAWLRECVAEDEAAARAAFSAQWDPENGWGAELSVAGGWTITPHVGVVHEEVRALHVARWNPARVLAECAAKRAILDEITAGQEWAQDQRCTAPRVYGTRIGALLDVARILAQLYADRPGFDPAWRVEDGVPLREREWRLG